MAEHEGYADWGAMLGQPARSGAVQALVSAVGPWQVKAYPSVGKVR
jgi:hypothetical protein